MTDFQISQRVGVPGYMPPETLLGLPASLVARMQSDTLAWQAVGGILIGAGASLLPGGPRDLPPARAHLLRLVPSWPLPLGPLQRQRRP